MKLNGHNPVDLIINHRKLIEKVFTILVVISLICIPMVGINYDLTKYLPDSSPSAQALDIMEDEFTYPGMGRVMLHDVTLYEAKNIKDRIADVEGVDMVMWADMTANIYGSSEFIDYDDIDDYYHEDDQSAYMDVIFEDKDSSSQTHKAVRQIEQIVAQDHHMVAVPTRYSPGCVLSIRSSRSSATADSSPAPPYPTPTSARPSTKRSRASWCSRSSSFTSS